jgi:hypothetical protein
VIPIEGSCRSSSGNWSTIGYGVPSNLPFFSGDGVSTVVISGIGFNVVTSTMITVRSALALRDFFSRDMIDDSINLMMGRPQVASLVILPILSSSEEHLVLQTKGVSSKPSPCLVLQLTQ